MLKYLATKLPPIKRLVAQRDMLRHALANHSGIQGDSFYDNELIIAARVAEGAHRDMAGGSWDEVGKLQFQFLVDHGLKPEHKLLDIGCGPLRGGLHFIPYLDPGNYWGIDISASLIEAGWNEELGKAKLQTRQPRHQLVCLQDFEFNTLNEQFDFSIAASVFTHLSFNRIRRCLVRLAPVLEPGGKLFATFFEVPIDKSSEEPLSHNPGDTITYSYRDPFHYRFEDFHYAICGLPMSVHCHGDWNQNRIQKMLIFKAN